MKYTKEDVIMCESKAKELGLKTGMEVAVSDSPTNCIETANEGLWIKLADIDFGSGKPFKYDSITAWECCIIKKEPKVKYIPYDLSKKEDRDELIGKRVISEGVDGIVGQCCEYDEGVWKCLVGGCYSSKELVERFTFADTGKPVGKLVEEVEE